MADDELQQKARLVRALVTGASGFVGRVLAETLADADMFIRAAARHPASIPPSAHVEPVLLPDLASDIDWTSLLADVDAVIHLAGIAHAGPGIDEKRYDRVNRAATDTLAAACAEKGIHLVFVSSIRAQTGPVADHVLTEKDTPRPTDAYGRSKLAAEDAIRRSGTPFTILRPVVMYGPGVKGNIATLAKLADTPWPLPFASFGNRRSLLAVGNLVGTIRHALTRTATQDTYIVADDEPVSLAGMIATMRIAKGRAPRLFTVPPAIFYGPFMLAGRSDLWERIGGELIADASKLKATGWRPVVGTREGLAAMVQAASPRKSGTASRSTP